MSTPLTDIRSLEADFPRPASLVRVHVSPFLCRAVEGELNVRGTDVPVPKLQWQAEDGPAPNRPAGRCLSVRPLWGGRHHGCPTVCTGQYTGPVDEGNPGEAAHIDSGLVELTRPESI